MKKCFKCGNDLPLAEFYRHPRMADGHLNKCKTCTRSDVHQHRHGKGRERVLAYDIERARAPHRIALKARVVSEWVKAHPEAVAAHNAVARAIKHGRLVRWPCEICGKKRAEAHHPDYTMKLDVVWLCREHHAQAHALVP